MTNLDPARMVPLDLGGKSLPTLIKMALFNIAVIDERPKAPPEDPDQFRATPREKQEAWLHRQPQAVRDFAAKYPLDKIYRVKGGVLSDTRGISPLGVIVSYRISRGAAEAGVLVLGVKRGLGSMEKPLAVTGDGLEDVTLAARAGTLPEQRE